MSTLRAQIAVAGILLALTLSSGMTEMGPARSQLEQFADGLERMSADFEQVVTGPDGRRESRGHGRVWLSAPHFFRWDYQGNFPELIVADGARIWLFDEGLEQVTVQPQDKSAADSPLGVLTDLRRLDTRFLTRELGNHNGVELLELTGVAPDAQFERIILGFREGMLDTLVSEDAFGLRTQVTFSGLQRNPVLDPALFVFTPPAGADVIGDLPDPN